MTHPTALADWRADPHGYSPPGGETHFELRRRSAAVLADIVASATRTVVVGHGVSGAVLRGLNLGLDAKAMFVLEKPQDAFFRLLAGVEERIACAGGRAGRRLASRSRAVRRQPPVSVTTSAPPSLFAESLPSRRSLPFTEATLISEKAPLFLATPWICHRPGVGARRRAVAHVGLRSLRGIVVGRAVDEAVLDGEHVVERRIARAAVAGAAPVAVEGGGRHRLGVALRRRNGDAGVGSAAGGGGDRQQDQDSERRVIVCRTAARYRPA